MGAYPEHDKLAAIAETSQTIGAFVEEFLPKKGIHLCEYSNDDNRAWQSLTPTQALLAEFFEIDQKKIDDEKEAMLAALRAKTAAHLKAEAAA